MQAANDNVKPIPGMAPLEDDALDNWQMVYVATCQHYIKIGTSISPTRRMRELSIQYIYPVRVIATFYGNTLLERLLHKRFVEYNVGNGNEFFFKEGALAEWVDAGCPDDLTRSLVA